MTLISLEQHKRLKNKEDLKKNTKVLMDLKQVNKPNQIQEQSSDSINDKYMKDALAQVRKSNTTIDVDYARFHGTNLYTESQKDSELEKTLQELEKEVIDELDAEEREKESKSPNLNTESIKDDLTKTIDDLERLTAVGRGLMHHLPNNPEKRKTKRKPKDQKEEVSWNRICEQLGHKRLHEKQSTSFFGQLRESLQTKQHRTLFNLKRSTLNEQ